MGTVLILCVLDCPFATKTNRLKHWSGRARVSLAPCSFALSFCIGWRRPFLTRKSMGTTAVLLSVWLWWRCARIHWKSDEDTTLDTRSEVRYSVEILSISMVTFRQSSRGFMFPGGSTAGQVISKWRRVFTHEIGNQGEDEKRAESKSEVVAFQPADGWKIEIALKEFIQRWFVILRWWEHIAIYLHRLQVCKCGHVKCNIFYYEWTVIHVLQYFNFKLIL